MKIMMVLQPVVFGLTVVCSTIAILSGRKLEGFCSSDETETIYDIFVGTCTMEVVLKRADGGIHVVLKKTVCNAASTALNVPDNRSWAGNVSS